MRRGHFARVLHGVDFLPFVRLKRFPSAVLTFGRSGGGYIWDGFPYSPHVFSHCILYPPHNRDMVWLRWPQWSREFFRIGCRLLRLSVLRTGYSYRRNVTSPFLWSGVLFSFLRSAFLPGRRKFDYSVFYQSGVCKICKKIQRVGFLR